MFSLLEVFNFFKVWLTAVSKYRNISLFCAFSYYSVLLLAAGFDNILAYSGFTTLWQSTIISCTIRSFISEAFFLRKDK